MHIHVQLPHSRRPAQADVPPSALGLRARVWRRQFELDRDLAAGARPDQSPEHRERARQLLTPRCRRLLLAELDTALAKAERPPSWHSASLPVAAVAVLDARAELGALRQALLGSVGPSVRGAAIASCLLIDPESPVRHACSGPSVAELATAAADAFARGGSAEWATAQKNVRSADVPGIGPRRSPPGHLGQR